MVFSAGHYVISEETSKVTWKGARHEFLKGAASSGLTSGPIKAPVFEAPLKLGAQQVSPGQRVTLSSLSGIAVSANGLAAEEAFKHDEQGK